jgi:hypothetical protein
MVDKVVKGNGHPRKLSVNLQDMAQSFVLQNEKLTAPWHLYATLNSILNIFKFQNINWSFALDTNHKIYKFYIFGCYV